MQNPLMSKIPQWKSTKTARTWKTTMSSQVPSASVAIVPVIAAATVAATEASATTSEKPLCPTGWYRDYAVADRGCSHFMLPMDLLPPESSVESRVEVEVQLATASPTLRWLEKKSSHRKLLHHWCLLA